MSNQNLNEYPPVLNLDPFDRSSASKNQEKEKSSSNSSTDKASLNNITSNSLTNYDEKEGCIENCQMDKTKNVLQEIQNLLDNLNCSIKESAQDTKNAKKCLSVQLLMTMVEQILKDELEVNDLVYIKIRSIIMEMKLNKKNCNSEKLGFNISVNIQDQNNQKSTKIVIKSTKKKQIPTITCNNPTQNSNHRFSTSNVTDEKEQTTNFDTIEKQIANHSRHEFSNNYDTKDVMGEFSTSRFFFSAKAQDYCIETLTDILVKFFGICNFELHYTGSFLKDKCKWNKFDVLMKIEHAKKFFDKIQDFSEFQRQGGYKDMNLKMQKNQHRHLIIFNCPNNDVNLLYNLLLNYGEIKSFKINYKIKSHEKLNHLNFPVITLHYKFDYSNWLCYSMINNFWLIPIPLPLRVLIMQDVKKNNKSILHKYQKT